MDTHPYACTHVHIHPPTHTHPCTNPPTHTQHARRQTFWTKAISVTDQYDDMSTVHYIDMPKVVDALNMIEGNITDCLYASDCSNALDTYNIIIMLS